MNELERKNLMLGKLYHMVCSDGSTGYPFRVVTISDDCITGRLYIGSRDDGSRVWTIEGERTYLLPLSDANVIRLETEIAKAAR